jgi:hypothetical protein
VAHARIGDRRAFTALVALHYPMNRDDKPFRPTVAV